MAAQVSKEVQLVHAFCLSRLDYILFRTTSFEQSLFLTGLGILSFC